MYAEVAYGMKEHMPKAYGKKESSIREIMKKEIEICATLALRPGVGCGCPDQGPCGTSKGL